MSLSDTQIRQIIERVDLAYTVVFLVATGEFVLADAVGVVIAHRGGSDQAGLGVITHH